MSGPNVTPRQLEILIAVVAEMKPGEVDWDAVAAKANCKTTKYARDQFNAIRKQLQACGEANGTAEGNTPKPKSAKKTPASKRKKEDDGNGDDETPTKKAKPSAPKSKSKSATPADTKVTPPAETTGDGETEVKEEEPNEAGAMMDDMNGTD